MNNRKLFLGILVLPLVIGSLRIVYKRLFPLSNFHQMLRKLNLQVCYTVDQCEKYFTEHMQDIIKDGVIGFDSEWKPGKGSESKVAVIQISSRSHCVIVQLSGMDHCPESLRTLLEKDETIKLGVGITGDVKKVMRDWGIHINGTVDLQTIAQKYGFTQNGTGLKALSEYLLEVSYPLDILSSRCSDWNRRPLSKNQLQYAAADAASAIFIVENIAERVKDSRPLKEFVQPFISCEPRNIKKPQHSSEKSPTMPKNKTNNARQVTRTRPLYYNCQILSPEGDLLGLCGPAKVKFFVDNELADVVGESNEGNLICKLRSAPPEGFIEAGSFYLQNKENRCVICGNDEGLIKHHVVPLCYRRCFPENRKSHCSYDLVLLCYPCHLKAVVVYEKEKERIARQLSVTLPSGGGVNRKQLPSATARSHSRALIADITRYNKMPSTPVPPSVPGSGWSGPYIDSYIKGRRYAPNYYVDFEEAKAAALANPNCVGLTRAKEGYYYLRSNNSGLYKSPSNEISYILNERWTPDIPAALDISTLNEEDPENAKIIKKFIPHGQCDCMLCDSKHPAWNTPVTDPLFITKIPDDKRKQLLEDVAMWTNLEVKDLTYNKLRWILVQPVEDPPDKMDHGEEVVAKFGPGDLDRFVQQWRQFFLDSLKPEFMPEGWKVDYQEERIPKEDKTSIFLKNKESTKK